MHILVFVHRYHVKNYIAFKKVNSKIRQNSKSIQKYDFGSNEQTQSIGIPGIETYMRNASNATFILKKYIYHTE